MFVNCTNHEIILDLNDYVVVIPPSGNMARVILRQDLSEIIDDVPIYDSLPTRDIKGLPAEQVDTIYITSATVAQCAQRPDVVCPNHAPDQCTRDHHGRIISVKSFLRYF